MEVLHFNSQKERLDYLRGGFEEIVPTEVVVPQAEENASIKVTEVSEGVQGKTAEELFKEIEKDCKDCPAWSGSDCTRNPYTEGCLKDEPKEEKKPKKAKKGKKKDDAVQAE